MKKKILILCSKSKGGMLSVIEGYQQDGVFDRWNVQFVCSHVDGFTFEKIRIFLKAFFEVFMLLAKDQVALIHCHISMRGSFWRKFILASLGRFFGIRVILHLHGSETEMYYQSLPMFLKNIVKSQFSKATLVLVLSESWCSFVLKVAPKANVMIMQNYVNLPEIVIRDKGDNKINMLFLGLLGKRKGIYDLLDALAFSVKNIPELYLRIGGNGDIQLAKAYAHELDLDPYVEFLGWVGNTEKNQLLRDADIFILPSYNEGLPVSIIEAMSWGIPVISTKVGGIPELLEDEVSGCLIKPGDIPALQNRLEQLARDIGMRNRIGSAGKEIIQQQYAKDIILPKLELLYETLSVYKVK